MKVLGKRLIVAEYQKEQETDSGIIIPETAQQDTDNVYEIVLAGVGVEDSELVEGNLILVGDRTALSADTLPLNGNEFKIFNEEQVIGVDKK